MLGVSFELSAFHPASIDNRAELMTGGGWCMYESANFERLVLGCIEAGQQLFSDFVCEILHLLFRFWVEFDFRTDFDPIS